jgi:hypothetical protein
MAMRTPLARCRLLALQPFTRCMRTASAASSHASLPEARRAPWWDDALPAPTKQLLQRAGIQSAVAVRLAEALGLTSFTDVQVGREAGGWACSPPV